MDMSGLFVFKAPGKDIWTAYDGRVDEKMQHIYVRGVIDREAMCRTPIILGSFDNEADAWLCVNELQRKEKKNEGTCATGQDGDVTEQMSGENQRCTGNTGT